MEIRQIIMGKISAVIPCMKIHHGWLLIYKATMQLPMSELKTGEIAVVSKLKYVNTLSSLSINISIFHMKHFKCSDHFTLSTIFGLQHTKHMLIFI